jgi:hypothetical protein
MGQPGAGRIVAPAHSSLFLIGARVLIISSAPFAVLLCALEMTTRQEGEAGFLA